MNSPILRFKEFTDEWKEKRLDDICDINPSSGNLPDQFIYIDLGSVVSGNLIDINIITVDGAPLRARRVLEQKDILFQMVRPYQMNNYFFDDVFDLKAVASTGYAQIRTEYDSKFIYYLLHTERFQYNVEMKCTGSNYPVINLNQLSSILVKIACMNEQIKIGKFLSLIDRKIFLQEELVNKLKLYKKGLLQKVFSDSSDWQTVKIGDVLQYEQPNKYIVKSTRYDNKFKIPVLTANKAFILGYTDEIFNIYDKGECIIFDDFTMNFKFVNFPYKVKSSALKILTAKDNNNIRFIYQLLKTITLKSRSHQRHYISIVQNIDINIPSVEEQNRIENLLTSLDKKVEIESNKLESLKLYRKGLLQQMFV